MRRDCVSNYNKMAQMYIEFLNLIKKKYAIPLEKIFNKYY